MFHRNVLTPVTSTLPSATCYQMANFIPVSKNCRSPKTAKTKPLSKKVYLKKLLWVDMITMKISQSETFSKGTMNYLLTYWEKAKCYHNRLLKCHSSLRSSSCPQQGSAYSLTALWTSTEDLHMKFRNCLASSILSSLRDARMLSGH